MTSVIKGLAASGELMTSSDLLNIEGPTALIKSSDGRQIVALPSKHFKVKLRNPLGDFGKTILELPHRREQAQVFLRGNSNHTSDMTEEDSEAAFLTPSKPPILTKSEEIEMRERPREESPGLLTPERVTKLSCVIETPPSTATPQANHFLSDDSADPEPLTPNSEIRSARSSLTGRDSLIIGRRSSLSDVHSRPVSRSGSEEFSTEAPLRDSPRLSALKMTPLIESEHENSSSAPKEEHPSAERNLSREFNAAAELIPATESSNVDPFAEMAAQALSEIATVTNTLVSAKEVEVPVDLLSTPLAPVEASLIPLAHASPGALPLALASPPLALDVPAHRLVPIGKSAENVLCISSPARRVNVTISPSLPSRMKGRMEAIFAPTSPTPTPPPPAPPPSLSLGISLVPSPTKSEVIITPIFATPQPFSFGDKIDDTDLTIKLTRLVGQRSKLIAKITRLHQTEWNASAALKRANALSSLKSIRKTFDSLREADLSRLVEDARDSRIRNFWKIYDESEKLFENLSDYVDVVECNMLIRSEIQEATDREKAKLLENAYYDKKMAITLKRELKKTYQYQDQKQELLDTLKDQISFLQGHLISVERQLPTVLINPTEREDPFINSEGLNKELKKKIDTLVKQFDDLKLKVNKDNLSIDMPLREAGILQQDLIHKANVLKKQAENLKEHIKDLDKRIEVLKMILIQRQHPSCIIL